MSVSAGQIVTASTIIVATLIVATVVDRAMRRRGDTDVPPPARTRFNALRRTIQVVIVVAGIGMALFVFPDVRGVAGAILSSAAFLSIVIGLAAQNSLGNFISGLVISFAQPIRIGDQIEFRGITGVVEDVARTYTRIRTPDGAWQLIPNGLLASDTIRNWTIVNPSCIAAVSVSVPVASDLTRVMALLDEEARGVPGTLDGREPTMTVTELTSTSAELDLGVWVADHASAQVVSSDLRVRIQGRLRREGLLEAQTAA
jgi:small-conductance mechanosensitive channel